MKSKEFELKVECMNCRRTFMIRLPWGAIWKDPEGFVSYATNRTKSGYLPYDAEKNKPAEEMIPVACKHCGAERHLFARNQDCITIEKPGLPRHTFPNTQVIRYGPGPYIEMDDCTFPYRPPVIWMLQRYD